MCFMVQSDPFTSSVNTLSSSSLSLVLLSLQCIRIWSHSLTQPLEISEAEQREEDGCGLPTLREKKCKHTLSNKLNKSFPLAPEFSAR